MRSDAVVFGLALALSVTPACSSSDLVIGIDGDHDREVLPAGDDVDPIDRPVDGPPQLGADPDGQPRADLLVDGALLASALGTAGDGIYWMGKGEAGYALYFVRPTGGPVTTVLKFAAQPVDLVLVGDDLYWSTERRGRLLRAALDVGESIELLYQDASAVPTAITATDKFVYFAAGDGCVRRLPRQDSAEAEVIACGAGTPIAIAAGEPDVFWGVAEGVLYHAPAAGGPAVKRAAEESFDSRLLIDDGQVFWLNALARGVMAMRRDGQEAARLLASAQYAPAGISMDQDDIYFATQSDHSIKRVPKSGGAVEVLIGAQSDPSDIALDLERAYWINQGESTIMAMAR